MFQTGSARHDEDPVRARDAALRRISFTRRWMIAGAAALTAGLAALVSALLPGKSLGAKATPATVSAAPPRLTPPLPAPATADQLGVGTAGQSSSQSIPPPPAPPQPAPAPAPAPSSGGDSSGGSSATSGGS